MISSHMESHTNVGSLSTFSYCPLFLSKCHFISWVFRLFIHSLKNIYWGSIMFQVQILDAKNQQRTKQLKTPVLIEFTFHWGDG